MPDDTLPAPTATSNAQAARLACDTERSRCLKLLGMAAPSVPQAIMDAIANGTPTSVFATNQRVQAACAAKAPGSRGTTGAGAGGSKWRGVTARFNALRGASTEAADADESAP